MVHNMWAIARNNGRHRCAHGVTQCNDGRGLQ
jgi:hypothetical protein